MFGTLTNYTPWFFLSSRNVSHFVWGFYLEMMASAKEATDFILVAHGGSHTYKPFKNRNLISGAQVPVLGNSVFCHSFIKVAEVMWPVQIVFKL